MSKKAIIRTEKPESYYSDALIKMKRHQKKRVVDMMNLINPHLKNINASWTAQNEFPRVARLLTKLCYINIDAHTHWHDHPVLKKFDDNNKMFFLHKIMNKSVNGKPCFKEMLCNYQVIKISNKTVYKIIDDLIEDGSLIYMPEYTADFNTIKITKNYQNIRPSVEVAAAYFDVYTKVMRDNLEFLNNHTKIKIEFDI